MLRTAYFLVFAAAFPIQAQNEASLEGRVLNAKTFKPIHGAEVTLNYNEHHTITDENGLFLFTKLPPKTYYATVRAEGYQELRYSKTHSFALLPGEHSKNYVLRLSPGAGSVTGMVRSISGEGIPSKVEIVDLKSGVSIAQTRTESGTYELNGIPPGRYRLCAAADYGIKRQRFAAACFPNATSAEWATEIVIKSKNAKQSPMDIVLPPLRTQTILGRYAGVCPPAYKCEVHPHRSPLVSWGMYSPPRLSPEGSFRIDLPPGETTLTIEAYESNSNTRCVLGRKKLNVQLDKLYGDVEIPELAGFPVTINLRPPGSLHELPRLTLRLIPPGYKGQFYSGWTEGSKSTPLKFIRVVPGKYGISLSGLPTNTYISRILSGNTDITHTSLEVADQAPQPIFIELASGTASIRGSVAVRAQGSRCIVRVERYPVVEKSNTLYNRFAACSLNGDFVVDQIAPGDYSIFAEGPGKQRSPARRLSIGASESKQINLALPGAPSAPKHSLGQ